MEDLRREMLFDPAVLSSKYERTSLQRCRRCQPNSGQDQVAPQPEIGETVLDVSPGDCRPIFREGEEDTITPSTKRRKNKKIKWMEDALVHSLRRIVAHDAGDSDLHLSLVEPGLEAPQTTFRARGVLWEVEPMQRQSGH